LSTAVNVYWPGEKVVVDSAMWNSVSVAVTLVPLPPPDAEDDELLPPPDDPDDAPDEPDEQPAATTARAATATAG
jgi:hypothetical protein